MTKAIILLSGGLDSTIILALALAQKKTCYALSFDYGQRHLVELEAAKAIAHYYQVPHQIIKIESSAFGQSSLVSNLTVPHNHVVENISRQGIQNTYVPARNTLFLAYAVGQAELHQAQEIHFGPNKLDDSCYVDCRPAYIQTFQSLINIATKQAVEGAPPKLVTPLINWDKAEIIRQGLALKVPLDLTISCYNPISLRLVCQQCDACLLREDGFRKVESSCRLP
jgi:7-cyano-7-deazaguanine synthase